MRRHGFLSFAFSALLGLTAGALPWLAAPSDARADFILSMDADGTCTDSTDCAVYILDGSAGDLSGTTGEIEWYGSIGVFQINLTYGLSKPLIGSASQPSLELYSINVSSSATGGTLTIKLTDTDFTSTEAILASAESMTEWITEIGGVTTGSVEFEVWVSLDNEPFSETGTQVAYIDGLTGEFTWTGSSEALVDEAYSVTLIARITHGPGIHGTGFGARVSDPLPEPGTLGMFGIGLIGLGLFWRRRWKLDLAAQMEAGTVRAGRRRPGGTLQKH